MTPKTIQIFLPGGDPQGIRVAELTTRIMQVIEVPRSLLSSFLAMPESNQVALYFLVGESEDDNGNQRVYIGQTGDLRARLTNHHQNREFWQRALVVISRTNSLTQTHSVYLEWHCIKAIREAGRYADENGNAGDKELHDHSAQSDHDPLPAPGADEAETRQPYASAHPPGQGRDWLARQIVLTGGQVDFVVAYWRSAPEPSVPWLEQARGAAQDASIWLFTSAEAIGNLLALLPGQDWSRARALATHPRIAQAARNAGFGVVWTSRPALLDVVASIKSVR